MKAEGAWRRGVVTSRHVEIDRHVIYCQAPGDSPVVGTVCVRFERSGLEALWEWKQAERITIELPTHMVSSAAKFRELLHITGAALGEEDLSTAKRPAG